MSLPKLSWALALMLVACALATYMHWPALTSPLEYKSDTRQSPHWALYHTDAYPDDADDDLLIRLATHNESPLQNLIYWVGTFAIDAVLLGKLIAVAGYGLAAVLFFWVGCRLFDLRGGVMTSLAFTFLPDQFEYWAGGFSKIWMIPIILLCVLVLEKRAFKWLLLLMPFAAVAYPVAAVVVGAIVLAFVLLDAAADGPHRAWPVFRALCLGSALALAVLSVKYIFPPEGIGALTSGAELRSMPEMYGGGMYRYLPLPTLFEELSEHFLTPFVLVSAITFLVVLGRERAWWSRSMTAVVLSSIVFYLLATELFMHLYQPNRYTRYSFAVLLALWHGRNWELVARRIPWRPVQLVALAAVVVVGTWSYRDRIYPGKDTSDRTRWAALNEFLATLPPDVLIAGHPMYMDDVPILAQRRVLLNYKLAHPWYSEFYPEMRRRTHAVFDACYANDPETVNRLAGEYGTTHLVVIKRYLSQLRVQRRDIYVRPYDEYIREIAGRRSDYLLKDPPASNVVYEDDELFVLALPIPDGAAP